MAYSFPLTLQGLMMDANEGYMVKIKGLNLSVSLRGSWQIDVPVCGVFLVSILLRVYGSNITFFGDIFISEM